MFDRYETRLNNNRMYWILLEYSYNILWKIFWSIDMGIINESPGIIGEYFSNILSMMNFLEHSLWNNRDKFYNNQWLCYGLSHENLSTKHCSNSMNISIISAIILYFSKFSFSLHQSFESLFCFTDNEKSRQDEWWRRCCRNCPSGLVSLWAI